MLLEDVDELSKPSTNMREATNSQRIDNSNKGKSSISESHVDAMSNSESGCKRVLHQSKTCGCIYDGDRKPRNRKGNSNECQVPRVRSLDLTENVNLQIDPVYVNENLQLPSNNLPEVWGPSDGAWSCPRICIDSMNENRPLVTVDNDSLVCNVSESDDEEKDICPVIRLSLRKPRHWKWKLTTSASSPAIILPVIQLLDEQGDLLLDTSTRSEFHTKHHRKRVDSNGNDKDFQPTDDVSRILQKSKSQQLNICTGKGGVDNMNNDTMWEDLGIEFVRRQEDVMGNLLLDKEERSTIPESEDPGNIAANKGTRGNRIRNLGKLTPRSMMQEYHELKDQSSSDNLTFKSIKGFRTKSLSRSFNKKKIQLHSRRKLEKRNNCDDSSTSSDSSPRTRRKSRPRNWTSGKKGDRLLEINGHPLSSYEEATELLRNGSDVVHLKFLHRRHSSNNRKGRHDPDSGSPVSSRRSKRRHHCQRQNPSSLNIDSGMGSNVSRHSEKGLSGRRTQSSGNLCNGNKILAPSVGRILVPCSGGVGPKDRNKFCGSLPNHLDVKHGDSDLSGSCCNGNNNNDEHMIPSSSAAQLKNKKNEVELRLHPLPPSCALDPAALHDQGYGSERSPEDEQPPSLPGMLELTSKYPFITREATFEVCLLKGSRGLGLSVTGGVDSGEQWPGLIRIKRLFPHQPAWQSGQLSQGDVLLAANGVPLVGLTNYQALEVLRKTPNNVILTVCRPPNEIFCIQAPSEPPPPPRRDPAHSISSSSHHILPLPLPPLQTEGPSGEFDIMLTKVNRSLGFTLRKEDESVLGHYVRALVREPALSDGRIRPGDKIVAVNDVDISPMSHEEAVMFLRQCGDHVKLRLYRDAAQTPVSALSPSEEAKVFKPKPLLRKEAMDMLSDLAVKKLSPCDSSSSSYSKLRRVSDGQSSSPCSSPRRRRLTKTPSPDVQTATLERVGQKYMVTSHVGNSDSSGEQSRTSTFTYPSMDSTKARGNASSFGSTTGSGDSIEMKPQRPNFLDLCGGSATPGTSRKQKFTFSVAATGGDDWDSLAPTSESDELATNTTLGSVSQYYPTTSNSSEEFRTDCVENSDPNYDGGLPTEPASMPPLTNLSSTSSTSTAFSYRNPAYQSAHPACYTINNQNSMRKGSEDGADHVSDQDIPGKLFNCQAGSGGEGSRGLLKWKGVVFTPENDEVEELGSGNVTSCTDDTSSQLTGDKENEQEEQVFMVELTRGWNSRLGFSLRGDGHNTYISAIYADSVAAKDGRLRAGDQVLMVNDESVEDMSTAEVIDLLRKIRGTIGITVLRRNGPNLQVS